MDTKLTNPEIPKTYRYFSLSPFLTPVRKRTSHTISTPLEKHNKDAEEFVFNLETASHWLTILVFTDATESEKIGQTQFDLSLLRNGDRVDSILNTSKGRLLIILECTQDKVGPPFAFSCIVASSFNKQTNKQTNKRRMRNLHNIHIYRPLDYSVKHYSTPLRSCNRNTTVRNKTNPPKNNQNRPFCQSCDSGSRFKTKQSGSRI